MEPVTVRPEAGLVDLLDRVLDRGLVIHADIMITLAGIPLVGLNLRAQLAGIETMLADPRMEEWDARIRARSARDAAARRAQDESRRIAALRPVADFGAAPAFEPSSCEPLEAIVA
jgi:hypothetical protein